MVIGLEAWRSAAGSRLGWVTSAWMERFFKKTVGGGLERPPLLRRGFGSGRLNRPSVNVLSVQRFGISWCLLTDADLDSARLHGFRNLAHEIDLEQAVLERSCLNLDMVGKAEVPLEAARGDALENVVFLVVVILLAGDRQTVLVKRDGDLVRSKARESDRNSIALFAGTRDVVRRIGVLNVGDLSVEEVEHAIEANGRPPQG
jgi:hypothetical protein